MNTKGAVREIRIDPVVPPETVLVATECSLRLHKEEERVPNDARAPVEICPRTRIPSGVERCPGLFVTTTSPEDAAARSGNAL